MPTKSRGPLERFLKRVEKKVPRYVPEGNQPWNRNLGRRLIHYRRVHSFLLEKFKKIGLRGKNVTHMGAGNGVYCDFLRNHYKVNTTAVELDLDHVTHQTKRGIHANFMQKMAENTELPTASQDIVLSDFFLFAHYDKIINEPRIITELARITKPKGIVIIERATAEAFKLMRPLLEKEFEVEKYVDESESGEPDLKYNGLMIVLRRKGH